MGIEQITHFVFSVSLGKEERNDRQRFITAINNVTEGEKKLKSLIRFHSANKIDNYNRGREKGKNPKEYKEQAKI